MTRPFHADAVSGLSALKPHAGTIRTMIVDDEPLAVRGLAHRLKLFGDVDVVARCTDGRDAVEQIAACRPDLIFLDIRMPELDGFGVVQALHELQAGLGEDAVYRPLVVFVTAYDDYALKAFDVFAFDYILKPVDEERLSETLARVRERLTYAERALPEADVVGMIRTLSEEADEETKKRLMAELSELGFAHDDVLTIRERGKVVRMRTRDLHWAEAERDYVRLHLDGRSYLIRQTMTGLEEKLVEGPFLRVHRSAIVNTQMVRELCATPAGDYVLLLQSGAEVRVGRSYRSAVLKRFAGP